MKKILMKYIPYCLLLCLNFGLSSHAKDLDPKYMAEIDAAIDSFKKYQTEISCGKIDSGKTRYVFRVPKLYHNFIGMFYHGDSFWVSDGIVEKENPCLYGITSTTINFKWPSMEPYRYGPMGYSTLASVPNLVTATIKHGFTGTKRSAFEAENFINSLKSKLTGNTRFRDDKSLINDEALKMGEYKPDLGLYYFRFDEYIPLTPYQIKQGITQKDHLKMDIFWSLDQDQRVLVLIICDYLGLDTTQMVIEETTCEQKTRRYIYDDSILTIKYGGQYVKNWKEIQYAAIKQFETFITEEQLP